MRWKVRNTLVSVCFVLGLPFVTPKTVTAEQGEESQVVFPDSWGGVALKTLDDHFPFEVPETGESWKQRREFLKLRTQVALGLYPMPQRGPIKATIHSPVRREGVVIEKVYFESLPGHFVTGLLFRPDAGDTVGKKFPAVLSPHGHGGRMMRYSPDQVASKLKSGGEKHAEAGQMPKVARCVTLARMGCITFLFDMVGYADSQQLSYEFAHRRHAGREGEVVAGSASPEMFFSTPAVARLQSIMGLQTWNALRSLDFLMSRSDVDPKRVGITGGSGGGTQTILLGALDERPVVSFPNGMVSTSMQGGCVCENACLLRVGTGNVELAGLFAPKPMGMTAADDWTREMMEDGFPELRRLYALLGRPNDVMCEPLLEFPHNYNYVTRRIMYGWMNEHLELGLNAPIEELDFAALTDEEGAVWNLEHPAPTERGAPHEKRILTWWDQQNGSALKDALESATPLEALQDMVRPAMTSIFDVRLPTTVSLTISESPGRRLWGETALALDVRTEASDANDPFVGVLVQRGDKKTTEGPVVVYVGDLAADAGGPPELSGRTFRDGKRILAIDAHELDAGLSEGIALRGLQPYGGQRRRASSVFTYGYNRPWAVRRCGRVLEAIAVADKLSQGAGVEVIAEASACAFTLPAIVLAGPIVDHATIATGDFRFGNLSR
ncbi:MAG: acetylxylan esterase, partial [Planctomycetota bacterium]